MAGAEVGIRESALTAAAYLWTSCAATGPVVFSRDPRPTSTGSQVGAGVCVVSALPTSSKLEGGTCETEVPTLVAPIFRLAIAISRARSLPGAWAFYGGRTAVVGRAPLEGALMPSASFQLSSGSKRFVACWLGRFALIL